MDSLSCYLETLIDLAHLCVRILNFAFVFGQVYNLSSLLNALPGDGEELP